MRALPAALPLNGFRLVFTACRPVVGVALMLGCGALVACTSDDAEESGADVTTDAADGSTATDSGEGSAPVPVTEDTLGWMRVEDGRLVDEFGRTWLIRGINARVEGIFDVTFDDGRIPLQPIPDFAAEDAERAVAMGFNMLRLPINWSGIEPDEGTFDEAYLARVAEVVELSNAAGLYVLLDFHQDAYSKEIGEDGAPLWAIIPPPTQLLQGPLTDLSQRRTSAQVLAAFEGFFQNDENIQDRFLPAFSEVVTRWSDDAGVIGIEIMNEPVSSVVDDTGDALYAFYEKAARRMREIDTRHTIWVEPDALRNFTQIGPIRSEPFFDTNLVYTPHLYPTLTGAAEESVEDWVARLTATFDGAQAEAESWGGAMVWGEWGEDPRSPLTPFYWQAFDQLADERLQGHAYWLWKERSQGSWGFFDYDEATDAWTERSAAIAGFMRPAAQAVPGRLTLHREDRTAGTLRVEFTTEGGESAPLLFLPPGTTWTVELNGTPVTVQPSDSGRTLVPWDGAAGNWVLDVSR